MNPFPGLRAFSAEESHLFFGRDNQVSELLAKLRTTCLLAVVGTSGSGKTSLVQGGLMPRLAAGFTAQAGDQWRIANFNPGNDPIGNMSLALAQQNVLNDHGKVEPNFASTVETTLRSSSLGLANIYKKSPIKNKANLLLIIDQFEEIFKFNADEKRKGGQTNDSLSFVNLLLYANRQKDIPIYVVMTMHADFLGNASEFRGLPEVINEGQYLIPRMKRQEIRQAIIAPLAAQELSITPNLTNLLLDELPEGQDELPILQHCLMRMWENWNHIGDETEPLDVKHYQEVGTMETALSSHAEQAYNDLSSDSARRLCEQIFKILIEPGRDGQAKRRAVTVTEISTLTEAPNLHILKILDSFGRPDRAFLEVPSIDKIEPETQINISHECLMRAWGRFRKWIQEESHSVEVYSRLSGAANLFYAGKAGYWHNPELQIGLNWYESARPNKMWANRYNNVFDQAIDFLMKSKQEYLNKLAFEEAERQEKLKRARRMAKLAMAAGIIGISLASISSISLIQANRSEKLAQQKAIEAEEERKNAKIAQILAEKEKKEADRQKVEADRQTGIAVAKTYEARQSEKSAAAAKIVAEEEAIKAALAAEKAEEAAKEAARQADIAAEQARNAEISEKEALRQQKLAELEEEKARIARKEADRLRILIASQNIVTASISADDKTLKALLSKEAYEINRQYEGKTNDPYIFNGLHQSVQSLYGKNYNKIHAYDHKGSVQGVASTAGGYLFTSGSEGQLLLWNIRNTNTAPRVISSNNASDYRAMALSNNAKWLVCGGQMPVWEVYNLKNTTEKLIFRGHQQGGSNSIAITPKENGFYSGGGDGNILYCNMDTVGVFASNSTSINTLALNGAGNKLAMGDRKGKVTIYKTATKGEIFKSIQLNQEITSLQFSPSGNYLAIGTVFGQLLIWNLKKSAPIAHKGHTARITQISYNQDGTKLLTASLDHDVRVWEVSGLRKLSYLPIVLPHDSWVTSATFKKSADAHDQILTGTKEGSVRAWDIDSGVLAEKLCLKIDRNLTDDEWAKFVQLPEAERQRGQTCQAKPLGNK